jgi:glucose/arabinose dehydrogenase
MRLNPVFPAACAVLVALAMFPVAAQQQTSTGDAALSGSSKEQSGKDQPGTMHKITVDELPEPYATESADNQAEIVARPQSVWPQAPSGFKVDLYANGLANPRLIRVAPNGDLFVAESGSGEITVLRGVANDGKAKRTEVFAGGLTQPFGINFYPAGPNPEWVYVANTNSIVRFPYENGDLNARGPAQTVAQLPGIGRLAAGGHWSRDVVFTLDGLHMLVSVGSRSNDDNTDNNPAEFHRADILEFTPEGKFEGVYAYGIRNCVGETIQPGTGDLWCSVNERDGLGDDLVPDYITHVQPGGFYGWPWFYIGGHKDPRQANRHLELQSQVIVPDVLLQSHFASLEMQFYQGTQFPAPYRGWAFAAEHGSWNRKPRVGYEVIALPMENGRATGQYEDFLTGFVLPDGTVWGRPVGIAVAQDGSLFVSDDGSNSIWRVMYLGHKSAAYPPPRNLTERASR